MIASLVVLLLAAPAAHPAPTRVVRVWLDQQGPVTRGTSVRVYVEAGQDGNLIVLHRRTDGRVEVLFPRTPDSDPFVRAGSYEIRGSDDHAAWVVAEPDGTGMVLAALSPDPLRFDEFVRATAWNEEALVPSWSGADPEGALSDVVQRMLGDGSLSYDVVSYTVAPPVYARQDVATPPSMDTVPGDTLTPSCPDCSANGVQFIVVEPFFGFEPFFRLRALHSDLPPAAPPMSVLGLTLGPSPGEAPGALQFAAPPRRPAAPPRPAGPAAIAPRPRTPAPTPPNAVAAPARPEVRPLAVAPVRRRAPASTGPLTHIRFTHLSAPTPDTPPSGFTEGRGSRGSVRRVAGGGLAFASGRSSEPGFGRSRSASGQAVEGGGGEGGAGGRGAQAALGQGSARLESRARAATAAPRTAALILPRGGLGSTAAQATGSVVRGGVGGRRH